MKKLFTKLRKIVEDKQVKKDMETVHAVNMAVMAQREDPYAHHWCRMTNYTLACYKCGVTHLDMVSDGRVYNRCLVHTNHPNN